jgi:hypothetical protein
MTTEKKREEKVIRIISKNEKGDIYVTKDRQKSKIDQCEKIKIVY